MKEKIKITFDGVDASEMTREKLTDFCYKNKNKYIGGFLPGENGSRIYDCLISLVEDEDRPFSAQDLHEHGMSDQML